MIASLQHWWSLAGVDLDYADKPHSLLKAIDKPAPQISSNRPALPAEVKEEPLAFVAKQEFPTELEQFLQWLEKPEDLIETNWARSFVQPEGKVEPEYMILSAMPESKAEHFSVKSQELVQNIVKALGTDLEHCFHTPLALGKPVDGRIPDQYLKMLVERALHLITLVKPKRIILFGDTVSRAFLGEDLLTARKKKQYINHNSSKTEAVVTFHPRILSERPELKTEAWKDLQQLIRIGAQ